jgi:hypothetical protein
MLYSTKSCVILLFGVSAKSKKEKPKTLRSLRLCGEQFFTEDPFRVPIMPPLLGVVIDC